MLQCSFFLRITMLIYSDLWIMYKVSIDLFLNIQMTFWVA
jgi:hypothetical protein